MYAMYDSKAQTTVLPCHVSDKAEATCVSHTAPTGPHATCPTLTHVTAAGLALPSILMRLLLCTQSTYCAREPNLSEWQALSAIGTACLGAVRVCNHRKQLAIDTCTVTHCAATAPAWQLTSNTPQQCRVVIMTSRHVQVQSCWSHVADSSHVYTVCLRMCCCLERFAATSARTS
jgi:hypothetical protein